MKTAAIQRESFDEEPSLNPLPPATFGSMPFAKLKWDPGRLQAALESAEKAEPDAARNLASPTATPVAGVPATESAVGGSARHVISAEFQITAPWAKSVKLAADFTEWERFPLDMVLSEDGTWFIIVPLPPGHYAYHFIVDGQWRDDPYSTQRGIPNRLGPTNSIKRVD